MVNMLGSIVLGLALAAQAPPPGTRGPDPLKTVEEFGLRIAPGFRITLFADQTLANDIYAMTLDSRGRVVVTSQGWIKVLEDPEGRGRALRASIFAPTRTGGMGMCFDGNDLYFSGDNGLWRFRDSRGEGKADGPPELISKYVTGEHGHHAIRKGPDGYWYLIGGNDAAIGKAQVTLPDSPVLEPHVGGIVRYTPDFKASEVIAHGFRNPYDFDFDALGDLYTYDSDCERDFLLPWYTPTRIYRVGYAMHHGWRLKGYQRSYANRDFYPDTVDMLWAVGRGSPTGVAFYRHDAFPPRYRDGLFALDWTFGKVYFIPAGASKGEIFLEPTGTEGFAPTDVVVAPDGALLVSIGGRRTRGAVYRIEALSPEPRRVPGSELSQVLGAPQPLDAWSRARWEPLAHRLGREPFERAALEEGRSWEDRVRALEVLVDLFGGPTPECSAWAANAGDSLVRARAAWAMGRHFQSSYSLLLQRLSEDQDGRVRLAALEAIADRIAEIDPETAKRACRANLGNSEKRIRQASARLLSLLSARGYGLSESELGREGPRSILTALQAGRPGPDPEKVAKVLPLLQAAHDPGFKIDALRLIVLGLGDTNLEKPPAEVLSNYSVAAPPGNDLRARILTVIRPLFPSGDVRLDEELGRLLAMLEDDAPETVTRTVSFLTDQSSATSDVHYLAVLSRLRAPWPPGTADRAAHALLSLGKKLEGNEQRQKQTWAARMFELATLLVRHDAEFGEALLRDPLLVEAGHVGIATAIESPGNPKIARLFFQAVRKDRGFAWSEPLIGLLSRLPREEFHPLLRAQWTNFGLRDSILMHLATAPEPEDRDKFLVGVESANAQAARSSLEALHHLPRDPSGPHLVPLLRLLRRLTLEPPQAALRGQVAELISWQSEKPFDVTEHGTDPISLKKCYQPVFDAFSSLKGDLEGSGGVDVGALLRPVPWEEGDRDRGLELFRNRGCQTCHAVQGALGPNLVGAASRFSREDLFEAIANPSKDIAPAYRTTVFQMKDGNIFMGIVAFESADGYIVQTGATTTVRINTPDIAGMRPGTLSLMPNGLVDGLKPRDLADLYAYLRSMGK